MPPPTCRGRISICRSILNLARPVDSKAYLRGEQSERQIKDKAWQVSRASSATTEGRFFLTDIVKNFTNCSGR